MKVRLFVTGSAALLAAWLTATFLSDVPVDRYPQFGKGSVPLSAKVAKPPVEEEPIVAVDPDEIPMASTVE
ncbi:hypothetical protein [Luteolibacter marinus]|uniref:hypothetical protein n=1 Tax=Luteolibacter marinus TaxID=2776705 RepID=UPI0018691FA3|nr:hypothetical protein [Luteolibacter marinus]